MHMRTYLLVACVLISACGPSNSDQSRLKEAQKQISQLRTQISENQKTQTGINSLFLNMIGSVNDESATVSTDTKDYAIARTMYGPFSIFAEKVEPYLDGYKVTLEMGNLSSGSLGAGTVTIQWGPNGIGQSKDFQVPNTFLPGRYTRFEFALTPAKPSDVKTIQVSLKFNSLSLGAPLGQ